MIKFFKNVYSFLQFLIIIILALFLLSMVSGCASSDPNIKTTPRLEKYGEDCFHKPYTNSRDNQSLCMTSAIAKHNAQVDTVNNLK